MKNNKQDLNPGIHALRGIAALMVVLVHAFTVTLVRFPELNWFRYEYLGGAVDIFFVISGYIMVVSTRSYLNGKLAGASFLKRRILRIVPLYWAITIVIASLMVIKPGLSDRPLSIPFLAKSLLFFPTSMGTHTIQSTLIPQGWSLVYEMFFYLMFALFASINYRWGLLSLGIVFSVAVGVYPLTHEYFLRLYTDPILLNFVMGMALGFLPLGKFQKLRWVFIGVGSIWIWKFFPNPGEAVGNYLRVWAVVPGATLVVAGFSLVEGIRAWKPLMIGGDISYSMYLAHMYLMKPFVKHLHFNLPISIAILGCIGIVAGLAVHWVIEKPMTKLAKKAFA